MRPKRRNFPIAQLDILKTHLDYTDPKLLDFAERAMELLTSSRAELEVKVQGAQG